MMHEVILYALVVQLIHLLDHISPATNGLYAIPKAPPAGLLPLHHQSQSRHLLPSGPFSIVTLLDRPSPRPPIIIKEMYAPPALSNVLPALVWQEVHALKRAAGLGAVPRYLAHWSRHPREVISLALSHVGNVNLHQLVEDDNSREVLARNIRFVAANMVSILHALHERGISHNDVKPSNFVLGPEGRLHIVDFGLAKVRPCRLDGSAEHCRFPVHGRRLVIAGYMGTVDPEVMRKETPDWEDLAAGDWFALGATLHYLLTKRYPVRKAFQGRLRLHRDDLDLHLEQLVNALLARRDQRLTDASPRDLQALMGHPYWTDVDWHQHLTFAAPPPAELIALAATHPSPVTEHSRAGPRVIAPRRSRLLSRL